MQFIPPLVPGHRLASWKGTAACILLAGMLSMLCAEVFSGASVLWIVRPASWLFTFPLYLAHLLFFLNLALSFRRTSLPALYFWGVLFALYESWITKVAWAGYMNQPAVTQTVLGFVPGEFLVIILFWHPVMSFIVPVLLFEALSLASSKNCPVLSGHSRLLARTPLNYAAFAGVAVTGSVFLAMNAQFNAVAALVTLLGTSLLVALLWYLARLWSGGGFSVFSLTLGKRGFYLLTLYLASLYGITFFLFLPERVAPALTLFLTVLMYVVVLLILWRETPSTDLMEQPGDPDRLLGIADLIKYGAGMVVSIVVLCLVPPVSSLLGVPVYIVLMAAGPVIAVAALVQILRNARGSPSA